MGFTKKYLFSLSVVVLIVIFGRLFVPKSSLQNNDFNQMPVADTSTPSPSLSNSSSSTSSNTGKYKDGSYTGTVQDAYYGNIQVKLTTTGGKIAKVAILQYPNENGTSKRINSYAIPQLQSEVIAAQSANINAVSGASFTSQAFYQSVKSALVQAN